jgi:hypothetical protein
MTRLARIVLVMTVACALCLCYCLFNTRHISRSIGYDEVFYFYWVDNWEQSQVYYPHHLLFAPTSVLFQRCFASLTGITNTAFIQKFKNILVVSIGLSVFFILFYAHSKRLLLSLTVAVLIGISGSLWYDVRHHETSVIPGVLVNLTMFSLVFYGRARFPVLFIIVFSIFDSLAILLHQAFLFTVPSAALVFLFGGPRDNAASRVWRGLGRALRRISRASLYLLLVALMVGGAYFYVGFAELGLRLADNPQGAQSYMSVPINGNFIRYFYLIQAYGKWGNYQPDMGRKGIGAYLSSFVISSRADRVNPRDPLNEKYLSSNATAALLGAIFLLFILFFVPLFRRYGILYPALLLWSVVGSLFIFWWEPGYIEHWIYITILTWVLAFMALTTALEKIRHLPPRTAVYALVCFFLWSFGVIAYRENFTHAIQPQEKLSLPASATSFAWKDEYRMDAIFNPPQPEK